MFRKLIAGALALAVMTSAARAQPQIDVRVVPSSVLKTVDTLADLDASFFAKYSNGEPVFLREAGREGVWVRRDNWAPQWLADADTANCVVKLDPGDASAPYTAFFREDWIKGSPLIINWCGIKTTNTALVNAQNFNKGEDLAGRMAVELIDKKAGAATVPIEIAGGDAAYPLRPGIVINRHGVRLDLGSAVFEAESGVSGALFQNGFEDDVDCNAITSSQFCSANKAIIENGTLIGDASALFAYDATAGQIGVLLGRCVFGCEVNNVAIENFDTGIKLDGSFGVVLNNNIITSSGTATPSATTACLYLGNGTATNVNGGRCDYSNGEGVVVIDGSAGATAGLNFYGLIIQGGEKRGLYASELDNFNFFGGDFENHDNSGGDYPFVEIVNTTDNRGSFAFYGTSFFKTGSHDDSNSPIFKWAYVGNFSAEDIIVRDQVRADITSIAQAEGVNGTARFSGRFQTNDPNSESAGANVATTMGVAGAGTFENGVTDFLCYQINGAAYADVNCKSDMTNLTVAGTLKVADGGRLEVNGRMGPGKVTDAIHVVSNAFTPTGRVNRIDCNGSGTCNVNTINGCSSSTFGDEIIVLPATSSEDPTLKNAVDNLRLDGGVDFTMGSTTKVASLMCNATNWIELGRATNAN